MKGGDGNTRGNYSFIIYIKKLIILFIHLPIINSSKNINGSITTQQYLLKIFPNPLLLFIYSY